MHAVRHANAIVSTSLTDRSTPDDDDGKAARRRLAKIAITTNTGMDITPQ
ncbi:MAG: hypothetical protein ACKVII_16710 [Planctomycetales bacterium]